MCHARSLHLKSQQEKCAPSNDNARRTNRRMISKNGEPDYDSLPWNHQIGETSIMEREVTYRNDIYGRQCRNVGKVETLRRAGEEPLGPEGRTHQITFAPHDGHGSPVTIRKSSKSLTLSLNGSLQTDDTSSI
jgi:hypothetical protein